MEVTCALGNKGCWNDGKCRAVSNCVHKIITNADRIRAMSDEELARVLYCADDLGWCKNLPECEILLGTDEGIPEAKCHGCLLQWLQQPVEEATHEKT